MNLSIVQCCDIRFWFILIKFAILIPQLKAKTFFHNTKPVANLPNIFPNEILSPPPSSSSSVTTTTTTTTTEPSILSESSSSMMSRDLSIGPCTWVLDRKCPDSDIRFYLYTRQNIMDRQCLHIDETLEKSNITSSYFNPKYPTKIILHGYNSDMFLSPLQKMREAYLAKSAYNIIYVDWSILAPGPCYISAVHNTRHTGACVAQLVERIRDYGSSDIHIIGFSLGAQLTNYIAQNLQDFKIPRITGLDPALPLFVTAFPQDKLDETDAEYVDVFHTNAFVQGKLERCGHADFYMNGGIVQPGCNAAGSNPFACSHQRATAYFLESIRTTKGFWGWPCSSYISYLLGMCPPTNNLHEAGENVRRSTRGMFFVETNETSPYALGKWTDLPMLGVKRPVTLIITPPRLTGDPLIKQIDEWGKLEYNFNNLDEYPTPYTPYTQNSNGQGWTYFSHTATPTTIGGITQNNSKYDSDDDDDDDVDGGEDDSIEEEDFKGTKPKPTRKNEQQYSPVNWDEYRMNLTQGIIDNSVFHVPYIRTSSRNWKRG